MPSYNSTARRPFATGGRVALKKGGVGKKLSDPNYGVKELPKKPKHLKRAKYDQEVDMGKVSAGVRFRSKQAKRKGIKKIQSSKAYKDAGYHKQVEMLGGKAFREGGRTEFKHGGSHGKKGTFQKIGEGISRKWRGKEKTKVRGIEQDKKTGALTHKAPKDRLDTQKGREFLNKVRRWKIRMPRPEMYKNPSKDMSYKERKKEIKGEKKEAKRKSDWEKKYVKKEK